MTRKKNFPIKIKNLQYRFRDNDILKNINLKIEKNKFYTIIGPNGSGKTTLLKNLSRIIYPHKKSIYLNEKDLNSFTNKNLARNIAYVPQNTVIDFEFSVKDIILMGRNPYISRFSKETKKDIEIVEKVMNMTNIYDIKDKSITELSGGERQRVIIARALVQDTEIILLDEPISNLDIQHQIEILNTIKFLKKEVTIISVLHDLNLAARYSDYLILFDDGKVVDKGTPEQVLTKENIEKVYNIQVYITKDPLIDVPHIIPIGKDVKKYNL